MDIDKESKEVPSSVKDRELIPAESREDAKAAAVDTADKAVGSSTAVVVVEERSVADSVDPVDRDPEVPRVS